MKTELQIAFPFSDCWLQINRIPNSVFIDRIPLWTDLQSSWQKLNPELSDHEYGNFQDKRTKIVIITSEITPLREIFMQ